MTKEVDNTNDEQIKDSIIEEEANTANNVTDTQNEQIKDSIIEEEVKESKINSFEENKQDEFKEETKVKENIVAPEKKPKHEFRWKSISGLGLIVLIFAALSFIYTYTLSKENISQNTLIVQKKLAETNNLLELYRVTKNENYLTLVYGNTKETSEMLTQTLLNQSSIELFFFPDSDYRLLAYLRQKSSYFEDILQGQAELSDYEIKEFHLILNTIQEKVLPTTSINTFVAKTDSIIKEICVDIYKNKNTLN